MYAIDTYRTRGNSAKRIWERCIEEGIFVEYLMKHEMEVVSMFEELFDQDYIQRNYVDSVRERAMAEGEASGSSFPWMRSCAF